MDPLLALVLLLVAGLLALRLRVVAAAISAWPRELDGLAALCAGAVLGPGIGVLDHPTLSRLQPLALLAVGWAGAAAGAGCDPRLWRRVPAVAWTPFGVETVATAGLVGAGAWAAARLVPGIGGAWVPRLPAVALLASVAAVSGPEARSLLRRLARGRGEGVRARARVLERLARLETGAGTLLLVVSGFFLRARPATRVGTVRELLLLMAAPAGLLLYVLLRRLPAASRGFALVAALLFGGGLGAAAGVSPFASSALAGALWVQFQPGHEVRALLESWERPMTWLLWLWCGAELTGPGVLLGAGALIALVRMATRWGALRSSLKASPGTGWPPDAALGTVAQGRVALGAGLGFVLGTRGALGEIGSEGVLTTIVLGVVVAQAVAPILARRALGLPLTPGRLAPELSPHSHAD